MALARTRRGDSGMNYWPGFVDALSTLILGIIFLLTVFVVVQFYLQQEVAGKDTALAPAERADRAAHRSAVAGEDRQGRPRGPARAIARDARHRRKRARQIQGPVRRRRRRRRRRARQDRRARRRARRREEDLRQRAVRRSRSSTSRSPRCAASSRRSSRRSTPPRRRTRKLQRASPISASGSTSRWRNACRNCRATARDFFGKLREILGNRPDIRIVGDRFVLQSEVFFDTGKADLKAGRPRRARQGRRRACSTSKSRSRRTSPGCCGSTATPTCGRSPAALFKSNWDLSAARAISVVQYLISKGVAPQRLVAAGFGEFQPIEAGTTEEAYRRNRRIELKLTER